MIYSQGDEEKYILHAVSGVQVENGRFLDIGAWHATALSNTRALFELGWSGVMVEPSPEPFLGLLREYGQEDRIQLLCGAVGRGIIERFHASADALSTSCEANFEKWKVVGGFYGKFYTPVVTLAEIVSCFGEFDFVSIDAEGTSVDLFHELLATEMRPVCICVEHDSRTDECISAAATKGYHAIFTSAENLVFAR